MARKEESQYWGFVAGVGSSEPLSPRQHLEREGWERIELKREGLNGRI